MVAGCLMEADGAVITDVAVVVNSAVAADGAVVSDGAVLIDAIYHAKCAFMLPVQLLHRLFSCSEIYLFKF